MGLYSPISDVVSKHTIIKSLARCFYCSCTLTVEFVSSIFSRGDECCYTTLLRNARNASRYEFLKDTQTEKALNNLDSVRVHLWNLHYMRLSNYYGFL